MQNSSETHRPGFTIIELLVVVAITTILISILVPSLQKARISAKKTQCLSRLKFLFLANTIYISEYDAFPNLNNDEDDGAWQYNYLIYDGKDFASNHGPLTEPTAIIQNIESLFCPLQVDEYHSLGTNVNPWPVVRNIDTRSAYGRRYHLSGKTLSQVPHTIGFAADVFHLTKVIRSAHKTGLNAVYTDGHAKWVRDPGIFTDNELDHPFDPEDNGIIEDMWDAIDEAL